MQDNDKYQVLSTKVDMDTYKRIKRLERSGKINIYRFGQMFWATLVRLMDDRHNLSPEMERLMQAFEYCVGWSEAFNTADPGVEKTIGEAIYFLFDADGKTTSAGHSSTVGRWTTTSRISSSACWSFPSPNVTSACDWRWARWDARTCWTSSTGC